MEKLPLFFTCRKRSEEGGDSCNQDARGLRCVMHEGTEMPHVAGQQVGRPAAKGGQEDRPVFGGKVDRTIRA